MSDSPPRRILVRGVNWLGDAVMTTPALLRLREAHPRAHIALLTQAKLADLWTHHPAIDQVLALPPGETLLTTARHLQKLEFDTALILPNSPRSALEAFLARIPRRIGHRRVWRNALLTQAIPPRAAERKMHKRSAREVQRLIAEPGLPHPAVPPSSAAHHVHQYLNLTAALGANPEPIAPLIAVSAAELEEMRRRWGIMDSSSRTRVLGLNAGAEYGPAKRWPPERFVAAAVALQRRLDCQWWILGGPGDLPLASTITAEIARESMPQPFDARRVQCLAGQTSLRELCAALKLCDAVLTNDTGPMHLAAAVGTRVIVPFGSTSPELTGPGLPEDPRHRLLKGIAPCSPCFRRDCPIDLRCMDSIGVDRVVQAVLDCLAPGGTGQT